MIDSSGVEKDGISTDSSPRSLRLCRVDFKGYGVSVCLCFVEVVEGFGSPMDVEWTISVGCGCVAELFVAVEVGRIGC